MLAKVLFCTVSALLLLTPAAVRSDPFSDECLACMCVASSDGCVMPDPPCKYEDWGMMCGPWGFTEGYWIDAGRHGEGFEECGSDWDCSEETVRGYMDRWVHDSDATCETYSRTHIGGPYGADADYTLDYWYEVQDCLEDGVFTLPPSNEEEK